MATLLFICEKDTVSRDNNVTITRYTVSSSHKNKSVANFTVRNEFTYGTVPYLINLISIIYTYPNDVTCFWKLRFLCVVSKTGHKQFFNDNYNLYSKKSMFYRVAGLLPYNQKLPFWFLLSLIGGNLCCRIGSINWANDRQEKIIFASLIGEKNGNFWLYGNSPANKNIIIIYYKNLN